jgi:predicted permease
MAVAITFFAVNSVVQHTLGVWFTSRGGAQGQRWPKGVAIACVLALAARATEMPMPQPVLEAARLIGSLAVPLMLLSLGHALATVSRRGLGRGAVLGAIRLLAGLLGGAAVVHLLGLPPLTAAVVALQLVMPVAVVSAIYVQRFSSEGDAAAGAVLVSTVVFLALCPLLIALAGSRNP